MRGDMRRVVGRGVFPHQFAWLLELPWRRLLLSPQTLCARLPLQPDSTVLELGPGSGYYSQAVAGRLTYGRLHVLDIQPEMLVHCRDAIATRSGTAELVAGDAALLPFADSRFDIVYMVTVFGEVADRLACLRDIRRVLKPAGILSISEHLPDPDFTRLPLLVKCVSGAGFRLDSQFGTRWAYTAHFRPS